MKKIALLLLVISLPTFAFAQGLTLSGEVKTGVFWQKTEEPEKDPKIDVKIHSQNDDAGDYEGRFRLNMDYANDSNTLGFKLRIQWQSWTGTWDEKTHQTLATPDSWPYAFGFGNFFDNQLTMSIGKLGGSPWGTGGPEMWKELEMTRSGGVRFEYKPALPEQYGRINVGFVLNGPEAYTDAGMDRDPTIIDLLKESVIGLSYTHDYFMVRVAYRLDSELDKVNRGFEGREGDSMVYRAEERAIQKKLPGFQIWALGYVQGVGADSEEFVEYKNWLFFQYAPPNFISQIRLGWEGGNGRKVLFAKPVFYYKFFDGLIETGALFGIAQDFGNKIYVGSPFSYVEVEPKLQINFAPGAYTAFVYNYKLEYAARTDPPLKTTQWLNLRFGIYF